MSTLDAAQNRALHEAGESVLGAFLEPLGYTLVSSAAGRADGVSMDLRWANAGAGVGVSALWAPREPFELFLVRLADGGFPPRISPRRDAPAQGWWLALESVEEVLLGRAVTTVAVPGLSELRDVVVRLQACARPLLGGDVAAFEAVVDGMRSRGHDRMVAAYGEEGARARGW